MAPGAVAVRRSPRLDAAKAKAKAEATMAADTVSSAASRAGSGRLPKAKASARLVTYSRRVEPGPKSAGEDEDEDYQDYQISRPKAKAKAKAKVKAAAKANSRTSRTSEPSPKAASAAVGKRKAPFTPARPSALKKRGQVQDPQQKGEEPGRPAPREIVQEDWGTWLTSNRLNPKTLEAGKAKSQKRKAVAAVAAASGQARGKGGNGKFQNVLASKSLDEMETPLVPEQSAKSSDWWPLPEVCVEKPEELPDASVETSRFQAPLPEPQGHESGPSFEEVPETPGPGEALAGPLKKVLVCGDLKGDIQLLQRTLNELQESGREVELTFAVGRFLPPKAEMSMSDFQSRCMETRMPCPVFFIESHSEDLISKSLSSKTPLKLGPDIAYLGPCGVKDIEGLTVAYLSGTYDSNNFRTVWGNGSFLEANGHGEGSHYTENAVRQLRHEASRAGNIDVLLTSEWPDKFWSTATKSEAPNPVDKKHCSVAVRELFFHLKPRYHVHASANHYRLRKANQGPYKFVCTSVGLCDASTESDAEAFSEESRKWFHVIPMRANCPEKFSKVDEAAPRKAPSEATKAT